MYGIYHFYQVDGGFGDAVGKMDLLFVTEHEELAKAYVEKWSNPYIYDRPYADLTCGTLIYSSLETLYTGELDQSPMDILGQTANLYPKYHSVAKVYCDTDLWKVENRPDEWLE